MIKFTYTKDNGDVSDRELVVLRAPSKSYFGIDVGDVEAETVKRLEIILAEQKADLDTFLADEELTSNYRSFLEKGVSFQQS